MKKLAKKAIGGTSSTPVKKKTITDVSRNPQYKSSGIMNTDGKMVYNRKTGSGPSKVPEGTPAASNYKKGGSFPDLNKDGKVTKADILKGRGVIKKTGGSTKSKKY